ncbi:MAG: hypothetical protein KME29_20435 [Calothrix sp. FI2-JRJ7]|jgi:hypothetical protein|nr:hypothetical protein [Calothrix sp. FI2-JRJ7]
MKPPLISRIATASFALLTIVTISSCNSRQQNAADTTTETTTTTTTTQTTPIPTAQATQAAAQGTNCPSDSPVKGVNSKRLGKIALTTKSPEYNTAKADKCFANTAVAQEAGYTVPK